MSMDDIFNTQPATLPNLFDSVTSNKPSKPAGLFDNIPTPSKISPNNLFDTIPVKQEVTQIEKPKPANLFAGVRSTVVSETTVEPVQIRQSIQTLATIPVSADSIKKRFDAIQVSNQTFIDTMFSLVEELTSAQNNIDKQYTTLVGLVDELKDARTVKLTILRQPKPLNTDLIKSLMGQVKAYTTKTFTMDLFLQAKINGIYEQSEQLRNLVGNLSGLAKENLPADDPLLLRILKVETLNALQFSSTKQMVKLLDTSYQRMETFRTDMLAIVIIEAQTALSKQSP